MRWRRAMRARRWWIALAGVATLAFGPMLLADGAGARAGTCYGTPSDGRVEGAVRLPASGPNFRAYCVPCIAALRTYGHEPAVAATVAAYEALETSQPDVSFVYGEIGLPWGGRFRPHRTHRNGLSFDFMVPLMEGRIPTSAANRFGYDVDFDEEGRGDAGRIDFAAIAAHLVALDEAARERGGRIARVILAPDLQDELARAPGDVIERFRFNRRQAWVRHDDHYHVDFDFPCSD